MAGLAALTSEAAAWGFLEHAPNSDAVPEDWQHLVGSASGAGVPVVPVVPVQPLGTAPRPRPRGAAKHKASPPRDLGFTKVAPIWLGSGSKDETVSVLDLRPFVAEDARYNENVLAVERLENDAGPSYEAQQKYVMAAECYEQAINLRRKLLGDTHEQFLASIERYVVRCNLWGIQCLNSGQYTHSLELLKKAEVMTEVDNVPNFRRRVALRAATFNNLCCYFRHRGKLNAALQFAEKALKIEQRYKDAENPARTHLNYAVLLSMMNRHEEAVEHIESAIAILQDEERQIFNDTGLETSEAASPSFAAAASSRAAARSASGGRPSPEDRLPAGECLDSAGQKRYLEVVSVLVVAYYNMWVELGRLSRRELGVDFICRAANISKNKLGPTHVLTLKTEESLAMVQEQLSIKAPGFSHAAHALDATLGGDSGAPPSDTPRLLAATGALPPMDSWGGPPLRPHESMAEALEAHQVTLRYQSGPKKPPARLPGEKAPFQRGLKQLTLQEHVYGRTSHPMPPEAATPFFSSRPKSQEKGGLSAGSRLGSPIQIQESHGAKPRLYASRAGQERGATFGIGSLPGTLGASAEAGGPGGSTGGAESIGLPAAAVPSKLSAETPASPSLRAAYEYHKVRLQLRESERQVPPLDSERLGAIGVFREQIAQRRERGLQVPTDSNRARAAVRIQALYRGYAVRVWSKQEVARDLRRRRGGAADEVAAQPSRPSSASRVGPPDMKRRVALRVVYAARRAFVEYSAAVKVQKAWRGWNTRRHIEEAVSHMAESTATKLQALFRRAGVCMQMRLREAAAIAIQAPWRRWIARRRARERRLSGRTIACKGRSHVVQLRQRRLGEAAMPIQRSTRAYLSRRRSARCQTGALAFQTAYRGWKCRKALSHLRSSVAHAKALGAMHKVRSDLLQQHSSAGAIQRRFRVHREQRQQRAKQTAASRIGALWHGHQARRRRPFAYSVCKIQAFVRGVQARERLRRQPDAALRIQNLWHAYRNRRRFKTTMALSIVLQKLARYHLAARKLSRLAAAAVSCQRHVRGRRARRSLQRSYVRARQLQAQWRSGCARWRIVLTSIAAQRVQTAFRRFVRQRRFQSMRVAAMHIQGGWRGHRLRKEAVRLRLAAGVISKSCRSYVCRKHLREAAMAARTIQQRWRRQFALRALYIRGEAAVQIQAAWRRRLQQARYSVLRGSSIIGLQRLWKKRAAQRVFRNKRRLAIALQAAWRSRCARKLLAEQMRGAVSIQCWWRRQRRKLLVALVNSVAVRLQAILSGAIARETLQRRQDASVILQRYGRCFLVRRRCVAPRGAAQRLTAWMRQRIGRMRYVRICNAALTIQICWRSWLARWRLRRLRALVDAVKAQRRLVGRVQQLAAATAIQRFWRGCSARARMRKEYGAGVCVQRMAKSWLSARLHSRRVRSAVMLQANWRMHVERRIYQKMRWVYHRIGNLFRCARTLHVVQMLRRQAAARIFRMAKVWLARRKLRMADMAARMIQRFVLATLTRMRVKHMKNVALLPVQCFVRRRKAMILTEKLRIQVHRGEVRGNAEKSRRQERRRYEAATRIQSCQRMRKERKKFHLFARVALPKIQGLNRMIIDRAEFRIQQAAAVDIQKCVRAYILPTFLEQHAAAKTIQSGVRHFLICKCTGRRTFNDFLEQCHAARRIQSDWRRFRLRWRFMRQLVGAVRIQAAARMYLVQLRWRSQLQAAVRIQVSLLKPWLAARAVDSRMRIILALQALVAGGITRKHTRKKVYAAIKIQAAWRCSLSRSLVDSRRYEAAVKIQRNLRKCYQRGVAFPRRQASMLRIQAFARGFLVRKRSRERHVAARCIQQKVRLARFRRVMALRRWLAVAIQTRFRANRSRKTSRLARLRLSSMPGRCQGLKWRRAKWPILVATALVLQRFVRARRVRLRMELLHRMATRIQTQRRRYVATKRLARQRQAARLLQASMRMWCTRRSVENLGGVYQHSLDASAIHGQDGVRAELRRAATTLQRFTLGMCARIRVRGMISAAVCIQRNSRGFLARRAVHRRFQALGVLQAGLDRAFQRTKYLQRRAHATTIQAFVRYWLLRHRNAQRAFAQLTLARTFRGFKDRKRVYQMRLIANSIRSKQKGIYAMAQFARRRNAAIKLQAIWRGWLTRDELTTWPSSATKIVAAWRRHRAHKRFLAQRRAGHFIVSEVIGRRLAQLRLESSRVASRVASLWRGYVGRRRAASRQAAAARIQKFWVSAKETREHSDMAVQILVEAKMMRLTHQTLPALIIQEAYRRHCFRKEFRRKRAAAVRLQALFRKCLALKESDRRREALPFCVSNMWSRQVQLVKDKWGRLTKSVEADGHGGLQAHGRLVVSAAALPQRTRSRLGELSMPVQLYAKHKYYMHCIESVQRVFRGYTERKVMKRKVAAAVAIQAAWRAFCAQTHRRRHTDAVVKIQALVRGGIQRSSAHPEERANLLLDVGSKYTPDGVPPVIALKRKTLETQRRVSVGEAIPD